MERYHIFKLGLAILFYAAYCIRPMMVNGLETDDVAARSLDNNKTDRFEDQFVFYQGVQGKPGVDFPVLSHIPRTGFSCRDLESGYYADLDTDCQVFHICEEGKKISFLCPNGTIFQQSELICEWWFKVNCTNSPNLYEESAEQLREDSARRKASRRVISNVDNYGAVMRMEERASVSTSRKGENFEIVSKQRQQPQKARAESTRVNNQRPSAADNHEPNRNDFNNDQRNRGNLENEDRNRSANRDQRNQSANKDNVQRVNGNRRNEDEYVRITVSKTAPVIKKKQPQIQSTPDQNNQFVRISAGNVQSNVRNQNRNRQNDFDSSKNQEIFQKAETQDIRGRNRNGNNNVNVRNGQNIVSNDFESQYVPNDNIYNSNRNNHQQGPSQVENQAGNVNLGQVRQNQNQNHNKFYTQFSKNNPNRNNRGENQQNYASHNPQKNVQQQNRNRANQNNNDQPIKIECCKNESENTTGSNIRGNDQFQQQNRNRANQNNNDQPIKIECCKDEGKNITGSTNRGNDQFTNTQSGSNASKNKNGNINLKLSVSLGSRNNIDNNRQKNHNNAQRTIPFSGAGNNIVQNIPEGNSGFGSKSKLNVENIKQQSTTNSNKIDLSEPTESEESQVPQETASFVKNSYNSIAQTHKTTTNPHPNHRDTYSDLKAPQYYSTKILSAISSVTPQYLTTQPINNGRPFIGSQVGGTTLKSETSTQKSEKVSFITTSTARSSTPQPATLSLLNVGRTRNTNQYLPTVSTTETVTNSIPVDRFNVGNTDRTIQPAVVPTTISTVTRNQNLDVPSSGSFNLGQNVPTTRPDDFVETTTKRVIDHATVYGKYVTGSPFSTSTVPSTSSTKIRYQPAQPFETFETANSFNSLGSRQNGIDSSNPKDEVIIRFSGNSADISTTSKVSHSKFGGAYSTPASSTTPVYKGQSSLSQNNNGFYVTKTAEFGTRIVPSQNGISSTPIIPTARSVSGNVVKPRPFQPSSNGNEDLTRPRIESKFGNNGASFNSISPTYPSYKISSASPFTVTTKTVTLPPTQPTPLATSRSPLPFENVDSMIDALVKMAAPEDEDHSAETPRPGLVIPPSAGPQTLHTLAVYFANALDGIAGGKDEDRTEVPVDTTNMTHLELEKKRLTDLLTKMTMDRYNELFTDKDEVGTESPITTTLSSRFGDDGEDLEGQHSKNPAQTPRVRQLAKVFTQALSSYLDDPATFKRVLQEVRPTEPPLAGSTVEMVEDPNNDQDELLNFSDADSKSSYPPIFPTLPSVRPTWGYLVAFSNNKSGSEEVKNSLSPESENLQLADSQSFVSQYNKLQTNVRESTTRSSLFDSSGLPNGHWTTSPGAAKLWKTAFSFDPATINNDFGTTEAIPVITVVPPENAEITEEEVKVPSLDVAPPIFEPHHEIKYELRSLPKLALNSTQVHGILIDFMNTTKSDDSNRLQRILRKLNTTEDEFLSKMKEIEGNPLTRRLILLLISECGNDAAKEIETQALPVHELVNRGIRNKQETLQTSSSIGGYQARQQHLDRQLPVKSTSNLKDLIDPNLDDDSEDARALQLLNSLYTIASRFGK